jgi:hypothetical protein
MGKPRQRMLAATVEIVSRGESSWQAVTSGVYINA